MENMLLPIPSKILNLQADWEKVMLICNEGKCHVISNLHGDWKTSVYENETKFKSADVGQMHAITVDENGKAYSSKTDMNIDSSKSSPLLFSPIQMKVKVDEVSCGKEHVLILNKTSGHVFSFGIGTRGQLGHGGVDEETIPRLIDALTGVHMNQVSAGGWHSLALSNIGDIYAWGWNNHGQLGITCLPPEVPETFYTLPYIVDFPQEVSVNHVACGARHSGAVMSEPRQSVLTWGWGKYGQLGHGDDQDRNRPTVVEYFENIDGKILDMNCGPWQTIVTLERKI
ncbi:RCC1 domain-containing protein 1-like [Dendronephthya gigantea]|uniref:RCC1 domain-containing protein 1-like n=1 Tax=Dendronephthya gigantea TaxID=151771 RepID=UPI001069370E|nr:RCC1 domain-containing protein 1-like [Dendronephthya gigantea]